MQIFTIDSNIPFLADIINKSRSPIAKSDWMSIKQANCLCVRSTVKVNRELLEGTNVEFVATATTGTDHIDIEYLNQKGIKFFAASGANSNSVAEYVIFSILYWAKYWAKNFQVNDITMGHAPLLKSLQNKKVGIIGFGNIGGKVAKYLDLMDIKYLICDPFVEKIFSEKMDCHTEFISCHTALDAVSHKTPNMSDEMPCQARHDSDDSNQKLIFCDIDTLVENCDIITTHIPLTFDGEHPTHNLLNENRIKKIKNNSLLISAARGKICDEKAMLNRKNELHYIIDVWENEPIITNRELIDIALLATPHIAGHSFQGKLNATVMIANKLNELYKMDLDLSEISEKISLKNPFEKSEMTNYNALFDALNNSRELVKTSLEMKQKSKLNSNDFNRYFNDTRLNYPEYYEILQL